ncbi:MAG: hypothetical protein K0U74_12255 [Alphaproteobacteria bacterium]|nr:hypothetical protein [Alphaproteobacteria bacterium]
MPQQTFKAVTLRPCWAHAVIHLGKDIENRSWAPKYRGPLLIHAGKNFKVQDYQRICQFAEEAGNQPPSRDDILVGGIIGIVDFCDVVEKSKSSWFSGPLGWVFNNARPLPFLPMNGRLSLFGVTPSTAWCQEANL